MPLKAKSGSIGVSRKWNQWHRKADSNKSIILLYCETSLQVIRLSLFPLSYVFKGLSIVEPKLILSISGTQINHSLPGTQTDHSSSEPPKYHSLLSSHPIEPYPGGQSSWELQKSPNLNIAYYFINILESPNYSTCHHRGGPITHTIDNFVLNPNCR